MWARDAAKKGKERAIDLAIGSRERLMVESMVLKKEAVACDHRPGT